MKIEKSDIEIIVKTNAKKTQIIEKTNNIYKIAVKALPEKGRANEEIIRFFSKLTKKHVKIIKGKTNRRKTLRFK